MATKITPLRLTDEERAFLEGIGEGSIIEGVRNCIAIARMNEDDQERSNDDRLETLASQLLREIRKSQGV
jgi:hypothetical protein